MSYTDYQRELQKRIREAKPAAKEALRELAQQKPGTTTFLVSYEGTGDEGGINEYEWRAEGSVLDTEWPGYADDGYEELSAYIDCIADFNNDGSHGQLEYDVAADKVRHRHYWYETVSKPERTRTF